MAPRQMDISIADPHMSEFAAIMFVDGEESPRAALVFPTRCHEMVGRAQRIRRVVRSMIMPHLPYGSIACIKFPASGVG